MYTVGEFTMFVRLTNLPNRRRNIERINSHGPFVSGRIIDLSAGAVKRMRFFDRKTALVLVEAVELEG